MRIIIIVCVMVFFCGQSLVASGIKITLAKHKGKEAVFDLTFSNPGDGDVSFVCPEVGFGRGLVVFVFSDNEGARIFIFRRKEDVTGHPMRLIKLSGGKSVKYVMDLKDGSWETPWVRGEGGMRHLELEYNVPVGTFDEFLGTDLIPVKKDPVFEGRVKTESITLKKSLKEVLK